MDDVAFRSDEAFVHPNPPCPRWYLIIKYSFCALFLLPLRLLAIVVLLPLYAVFLHLSVIGVDLNTPPSSRRGGLRFKTIKIVSALMGRVALLVAGFWKLNVSGTIKADVGTLVANHTSWLDVLVLGYLFGPSFVAKASVQKLPIVRVLGWVYECIYVNDHPLDVGAAHADHSSSSDEFMGIDGETDCDALLCDSTDEEEHVDGDAPRISPGPIDGHQAPSPPHDAHHTIERTPSSAQRGILAHQCDLEESKRKLLIFPEGTTTNGRFVIRFRKGAFLGGVPVQPIAMRWRYRYYSPTWESIPLFSHVFLGLLQISNSVDVIVMDAYYPSEKEMSNPQLYADNVQKAIASTLGVPASKHCIRDKLNHHARILRGEISWKEDPPAPPTVVGGE